MKRAAALAVLMFGVGCDRFAFDPPLEIDPEYVAEQNRLAALAIIDSLGSGAAVVAHVERSDFCAATAQHDVDLEMVSVFVEWTEVDDLQSLVGTSVQMHILSTGVSLFPDQTFLGLVEVTRLAPDVRVPCRVDGELLISLIDASVLAEQSGLDLATIEEKIAESYDQNGRPPPAVSSKVSRAMR